jgi:hypothetical protein
MEGEEIVIPFNDDDGTGPPEFYAAPQGVDGYEIVDPARPGEVIH